MALELSQVSIRLEGRELIRPFNLSIGESEIVTLMGPSGCGKSSLLSHIAGDLSPPLKGSGQVLLEGVDMSTTQPARRRIGRMFQDDLLFPHMTIGENMLFGVARGEWKERTQKMQTALEVAGLAGFEDRDPATLSGGQRQRVSLMRALLAEPRAMLLDEPFNQLDEELRQSMRELVYSRLIAAGIHCLLVTHDRADAPAGGRVMRIAKDGEVSDV